MYDFDLTIPIRVPFLERRNTLVLALFAVAILDRIIQLMFWKRPAHSHAPAVFLY